MAPGANGLRFSAIDDAGRIWRRRALGRSVAAVHAFGVPGDDFAIDDDGSTYITTHVHDSVVKVDPAGNVLGTVATATEGIVGSTAAIIVRDDEGAKWLYVTNDGGLLAPAEGGPPRPNVARLLLAA
ncbi:MAG TPA: hypothetical protein VNT55_18980 [Baekduia sp.]|nr:hypothetical protein [Baekduia sp.]